MTQNKPALTELKSLMGARCESPFVRAQALLVCIAMAPGKEQDGLWEFLLTRFSLVPQNERVIEPAADNDFPDDLTARAARRLHLMITGAEGKTANEIVSEVKKTISGITDEAEKTMFLAAVLEYPETFVPVFDIAYPLISEGDAAALANDGGLAELVNLARRFVTRDWSYAKEAAALLTLFDSVADKKQKVHLLAKVLMAEHKTGHACQGANKNLLSSLFDGDVEQLGPGIFSIRAGNGGDAGLDALVNLLRGELPKGLRID